jgi:hypothetical protein
MIYITQKICSKCNKSKEITEFYKNKSICKKCHNEYYKNYAIVNKNKIKEYQKSYRNVNKEELKEYQKEYVKNHKGKKYEYDKNRRQELKEEIIIYKSNYYKRNKKRLIEKQKNYYKNHKKEKKEYDKIYNKKNILKINKRRKEKRKNDINFKISHLLRNRIKDALKNNTKSIHTLELLGCSLDQFKQYLQNTAINNGYLNFDINNYSGKKYHIDHIIPCSKFNLKCSYHQKLCFHWSNMQILDAYSNFKKNNKI